MSNCLCLECDDENLGENFEWGKKGLSEMRKLNAFFRNVNTIKIFTTQGEISKSEKKIPQAFWREIKL